MTTPVLESPSSVEEMAPPEAWRMRDTMSMGMNVQTKNLGGMRERERSRWLTLLEGGRSQSISYFRSQKKNGVQGGGGGSLLTSWKAVHILPSRKIPGQ